MEMEVRCFLSAIDPVVLERKYSEGPIRLDERLCDSLGRDQYGPALLLRKIEQRRDMPTCDDAALANFELPRIDHGQGMFAFVNDRPSFFATCHPFTKVARISYGKFEQVPSPTSWFVPSGVVLEATGRCNAFCEDTVRIRNGPLERIAMRRCEAQ